MLSTVLARFVPQEGAVLGDDTLIDGWCLWSTEIMAAERWAASMLRRGGRGVPGTALTICAERAWGNTRHLRLTCAVPTRRRTLPWYRPVVLKEIVRHVHVA